MQLSQKNIGLQFSFQSWTVRVPRLFNKRLHAEVAPSEAAAPEFYPRRSGSLSVAWNLSKVFKQNFFSNLQRTFFYRFLLNKSPLIFSIALKFWSRKSSCICKIRYSARHEGEKKREGGFWPLIISGFTAWFAKRRPVEPLGFLQQPRQKTDAAALS
jgi:hypothetical protein